MKAYQLHFANWVEGIKVIKEWEIPRCFFQSHWGDLEGIELHSFGHASPVAVVYIRKPNPDGTYQIAIVIALVTCCEKRNKMFCVLLCLLRIF